MLLISRTQERITCNAIQESPPIFVDMSILSTPSVKDFGLNIFWLSWYKQRALYTTANILGLEWKQYAYDSFPDYKMKL